MRIQTKVEKKSAERAGFILAPCENCTGLVRIHHSLALHGVLCGVPCAVEFARSMREKKKAKMP